jgi:rod shape-determining protein MreD
MSLRYGRASHRLPNLSPYVVCLLLVVVALAQSSLSPRLALLGVQPNLMLLAVLSWSLLRGGREGLLWAFGGGVLVDILSGAPLGVSSLSLLLVSLLSSQGELAVFGTTLSLPLFVGFVGSLLHDLSFLFMLQLLGWSIDWPTALSKLLLLDAGLNTVFMPLMYVSLRWLHRRTKGAELAW